MKFQQGGSVGLPDKSALDRFYEFFVEPTEYGYTPDEVIPPQDLYPSRIAQMAKILFDVDKSAGKDVVDPSTTKIPTEPEKLMTMVADVFSKGSIHDLYSSMPVKELETVPPGVEKSYIADVFNLGRPYYTGKAYGDTDVQDIVKLISQEAYKSDREGTNPSFLAEVLRSIVGAGADTDMWGDLFQGQWNEEDYEEGLKRKKAAVEMFDRGLLKEKNPSQSIF